MRYTQSMPFTTKYPKLGNTLPLRVPYALHTYVLRIAEESERLCVTHSEDYALRILDKVIEGLEQVP